MYLKIAIAALLAILLLGACIAVGFYVTLTSKSDEFYDAFYDEVENYLEEVRERLEQLQSRSRIQGKASHLSSGWSDDSSGGSDDSSGGSDYSSGWSDDSCGLSYYSSGGSDDSSGLSDYSSGWSDDSSECSEDSSGWNDDYTDSYLNFSEDEKVDSCCSYKSPMNHSRMQFSKTILQFVFKATSLMGPRGKIWLPQWLKSNEANSASSRKSESNSLSLAAVKEYRYECLSALVMAAAILLRKHDYGKAQSVSLLWFVLMDCVLGRHQRICEVSRYISRRALGIIGSPAGRGHAFSKDCFGLIISAICEYFLKRKFGCYVNTSLLQDIVFNGVAPSVLKHLLGLNAIVHLLKPNICILAECLNRRDLDLRWLVPHIILVNIVPITAMGKFVIQSVFRF